LPDAGTGTPPRWVGMTAESDRHDDVAGACAAFGLTGFRYHRFAPSAPPPTVHAATEPPASAPPPAEEAPPPLPMREPVHVTPPVGPAAGAVLPVPFGTLAARIAARRPAVPAQVPLRLVWDPAPPAATPAPSPTQEPSQGGAPERNLGGMFRRL
jgi:hypothetical protein